MKQKILFFVILVAVSGIINYVHAQNIHNINRDASTELQNMVADVPLASPFKQAQRYRPFEVNRQLHLFSSRNIGDTLLLDFFHDRRFKAVITAVTRSNDGITGITAQIPDNRLSYCYISVSAAKVSIRAELAEMDECFFAAVINGVTHLAQVKLSEINKDELPCTAPPADNAFKERVAEMHSHAESSNIAVNDVNDPITIKLLVVYTPAAAQWALNSSAVTDINDVIDQAMQRANLAMVNSGTSITFQLVHKYQTNYVEANSNIDLERITGETDGYMDEIHDMRAQYGADVTVFIPDVNFTGGVAWLLKDSNGRPERAFALCRVQQMHNSFTMVHEVGHVMGCGHSKSQNYQPGPGIFSYSAGWRGITSNNTRYSTIMTYESGNYYTDGETRPRIPYFSSPNITFEGVPIGNATDADNVRSLKQTKQIVSQYHEKLTDVALNSLSVGTEMLTPAFSPMIYNYKVTVPQTTTGITIAAVARNPLATVSGTGTKNLSQGINVFSVVVTAGTGGKKRIYTIVIVRGIPIIKSPPLDEGFEGSLAGWTFAGGAEINQWTVGTATAASGTKSAYISNNNGAANSYSVNAASVAHLFCDVNLPASSGTYELSFDWKGKGESGTTSHFDYLEVRVIDTNMMPKPGLQLSSGSVGRQYVNSTGWEHVVIPLPTAYSGTAKRFVFTWINDELIGDQPAAAIDNIVIKITGTQSVTGVSLNKTASTITGGNTEQLTATVTPSNAGNKAVLWSSNNTTVATVNPAGLVTAVTAGAATITATTQDGGYTATCAVTVIQLVTGVSLNKTASTITSGNTEQLTATVTPSNAGNKAVLWSSNNTAVATVNPAGLVTAATAGAATITATTQDGGYTATCTIIVVDLPINFTAFTLDNGAQVTVYRTVQLNYTFSGGQPAYFRVAESEAALNGAAWQVYNAANLVYTFNTDIYERKTVYTQLRNSNSETAVKNATITYKSLQPKLSLTSFSINGNAQHTVYRTVILSHEVGNGIPQWYSVAENSADIGETWLSYTKSPLFTLSNGAGLKKIYFAVANKTDTSDVVSAHIYLDESGTIDAQGLSARLFPNPAESHVWAIVDNISQPVQITVYSITGEIYMSQTFNATTFMIDLSLCPAGTLQVRIASGNNYIIKQIMKY